MKQLKLNTVSGQVWDLVLSVDSLGQSQLVTIADKDYIPQKAKQLLLTGRGEIFTNTQYGVPWFQEILGKGADLGNIRSILLDVLDSNTTLEELGVTNIDISSLVLDTQKRHLIVKDLVLSGDSDEETTTIKGITI